MPLGKAPPLTPPFKPTDFSELTEFQHFMAALQDGLRVTTHREFYQWLQGSFQRLIPHRVFISAWGDFTRQRLLFDVVSDLPGLRTHDLDARALPAMLMPLHATWHTQGRAPLHYGQEQGRVIRRSLDQMLQSAQLQHLDEMLIHGTKDQRGRQDCLFIALGDSNLADERVFRWFEVLLPYVDAALRQVALLPQQDESVEAACVAEDIARMGADGGCDLLSSLSEREFEIMRWVALGKTNIEIGLILDISSFTVKNHLQRIYRKLNVFNRAQSVALFESCAKK